MRLKTSLPKGHRGGEHTAAMEAFAREIGFERRELSGERRAIGFWNPQARSGLPANLVANMETLVSSKFDPSRQSEFGYRKSGSAAGKVRTLQFNLGKPITVDGRRIFGVRLRAVAFDPDNLDKEFRLTHEHVKLGLRKPVTLYDMSINEKGIVEYTPLVNEPEGGMFCRATLHESIMHRLCRSRDEDVDVLLKMGFYSGKAHKSGNVMAYDALGLVDERGVTTGELIHQSFLEKEEGMRRGEADVIDGFQDDINLFTTRHVERLWGFHANQFCHHEPHHGNFRQSRGGRVVVADLHDALDMTVMTYEQRIGHITWDIIGPLMYARMRERQVLELTGKSIDFMSPALKYFQNIEPNDPVLSELDRFTRIDERGWCTLRDLHNLSDQNLKLSHSTRETRS